MAAVVHCMQPSYTLGSSPPVVRGYAVKAGETFYKGAPLTLSSNTLEELDTNDVTDIVGIALAPATVAATPDWGDEIPVALADAQTIFVAPFSSNGTAIATDLSAVYGGAQYGVVKIGNFWVVDGNDETNVVVEIEDVSDDLDIVWFRFLASTLLTA